MVKPVKSVTHPCQRESRPTFKYVAHDCPVTGTKLYRSVTEAHACEQLAAGCYPTAARSGVEPGHRTKDVHKCPCNSSDGPDQSQRELREISVDLSPIRFPSALDSVLYIRLSLLLLVSYVT